MVLTATGQYAYKREDNVIRPLLDVSKGETYDFLKEHNMRMNDIIERKMGHSTVFKNPIIESLEECMRAYVSPASINFSNHVRTSMAIFHKNISMIDWSVK